MSSRMFARSVALVSRILALLLVSCAGLKTPLARAPAGGGEADAPFFELRNDFWSNLHQRLYAESSEWRFPATPQAGADAFRPEERAAWDAALAGYRKRFPERDSLTPLTPPLLALEQKLSRAGNSADLKGAGLEPELASELEEAAAAYRAHGWPADERENQAWIEKLAPRLKQHGAELSKRLVAIYGKRWPARVPVDVAVYAGPLGAYSDDAPPWIAINSDRKSYQDDAALEMIFHEGSHLLIGPVEDAIARECQAQHRPVPDGLWHALIFYTAGELVRAQLPGYEPYATKNGLFGRPPWVFYEKVLKAHWQPYLDGKSGRDEALRALIAALPREGG
jgi:hypothetical protein